MVGRPRIRGNLWEKVVERAEEEGMDPSEVIEDAIERFLGLNGGLRIDE